MAYVHKTPLEQRYRSSVDAWVKLTQGDAKARYGEKLTRAVNKMNRLREELLKEKNEVK